MTKPRLVTFLIGNSPVAIAIMLGGIWLIWRAIQNEVSGYLGLAALIAIAIVSRAFEQVQRYGAWKREWDAMNGNSTRGLPRAPLPLRLVFGGVIWCGFAYAAITAETPWMKFAASMFWLGSFIALAWASAMFARRVWRRASAKQVVVSICLAVPRQSPTYSDASNALPPYCKSIVGRASGSAAA